jgi:hypothetical protein
MRYLANGREELPEQIRFDQHEVFASLGAGTLDAEDDTVAMFPSEEEFLDWVRRSDPKVADQISQLMTGLDQLGIARRERGADVKQSLHALLDEEKPHGELLSTGLVLYEHINYGGRSFDVRDLIPYVDLNLLPWWRFNDKTSSLKLRHSVCAVFEHTWFKGRSWWIWPGPKDIPWVGESWNDRISSCICGPSYEEVLKLILKYLL